MELLTKKVLVRFNEAEYEALQRVLRETGENQNTLIRKVVAYACGAGDVHEEVEARKVTEKVQHAANMRARRWAGKTKAEAQLKEVDEAVAVEEALEAAEDGGDDAA